MSDRPQRRSPSGTIAALGTSAVEVNSLVRAVASSAAVEIVAHPEAKPVDLAEAIAKGVYEPIGDAALKIRDQGRRLGYAVSREAFALIKARLGEALTLLDAPALDIAALRRAITTAAVAIPVEPPESLE